MAGHWFVRHSAFRIYEVGYDSVSAHWLSKEPGKIKTFTTGLLPPLGLIGLAFGIIMLQPDLGTGTVMMGASMLIIFTAGARMKHLSLLALGGVAGFAL